MNSSIRNGRTLFIPHPWEIESQIFLMIDWEKVDYDYIRAYNRGNITAPEVAVRFPESVPDYYFQLATEMTKKLRTRSWWDVYEFINKDSTFRRDYAKRCEL